VGDNPKPLEQELDAELGDIALAYETCREEATQSKTNFVFHVQHLIVHGILHLLGYDHSSDADATLMEDLESQILGNLGVNAHTHL
jgi:probable rRNA maturation factor